MEQEKQGYFFNKWRKVSGSYLSEIVVGVLLMIAFFAIILIILQ